MQNENPEGERPGFKKLTLHPDKPVPQADWIVAPNQQDDLTIPMERPKTNSLGVSAKIAAFRSPVSPVSGPPPNNWTAPESVTTDPTLSAARKTRNLRPEDLIVRRTTNPNAVVPPRESVRNFVYLVKTERAYQVLLGALALVVLASIVLIVFLNLFLFQSPPPANSQVTQPVVNQATATVDAALSPTYTYVTPTITPSPSPTSTIEVPDQMVSISGPPTEVVNGMTLYIYVSSNIPNAQVQVTMTVSGNTTVIGSGHTNAAGSAQITWRVSSKRTVTAVLEAHVVHDGDTVISNQLTVKIRSR
jgi:hypothetical protein